MYPKFLFTCLFAAGIFGGAMAQNYEDTLKRADSLFAEKRYSQAFDSYEKIYREEQLFSPSMLLKMAFIREGLGDYTMALYYLNLFYRYNPEQKVLKKMDELAVSHRLSGYQYTDIEYFIFLYHQYYNYIIYFFLLAAFIFYVYLIIKTLGKRKLGLRPLIFIAILLVAFLFSNFELVPMRGIISSDNALLMAAPSSAAPLQASVSKGHRVVVLSRHDTWYRIRWEGEDAFIRKNQLLLIGEKEEVRSGYWF